MQIHRDLKLDSMFSLVSTLNECRDRGGNWRTGKEAGHILERWTVPHFMYYF